MTGTISSDPQDPWLIRRGSDYITTLPYEAYKVRTVCTHSPLYIIKLEENQPPFCGLCLLREGFEAELPKKFHVYKTLAENGNPETAPKFIAHLVLVMGLVPPKDQESLKDWRKRRTALAREQYTARSPLPDHKLVQRVRSERFSSPSRLFPVASALWQLMGFQPPLGRVLVPAVGGKNEIEIAAMLKISYWDTHIRMAKAIRTTMGFLPHDRDEAADVSSSSALS